MKRTPATNILKNVSIINHDLVKIHHEVVFSILLTVLSFDLYKHSTCVSVSTMGEIQPPRDISPILYLYQTFFLLLITA